MVLRRMFNILVKIFRKLIGGGSVKERNVGAVFYEVEVYDKNGKLVDKKEGKGDSVLDNWINLMRMLRDPESWSYQWGFFDVGGTERHISNFNFSQSSMKAPEEDDSYGIIVGTGTTPVSLEDYNLASKISHGTGSGQLSYGACSPYGISSDTQADVGLQRSFDNNSGADITINEIGMVLKVYDGTNTYYTLIMRDVISATTVPNGGRVTIKYWFRYNPS